MIRGQAVTQSRRSFLKNAAFLPSALYLSQCKTVGRTGTSESFLKFSPVDSSIPKRVSWKNLPDPDKEKFIQVIRDMKLNKEMLFKVPETFGEGGARELDAWAAQAEVHNWYCPHSNWLFLPWHRAYLYHFELFLRKNIRDDFRLPYWDWTDKDQLEIPKGLQDSDLLAALKVERATQTIAQHVPDANRPGGWPGAIAQIGLEPNFDGIGGTQDYDSGTIENPYHNRVHSVIGAPKPGERNPRTMGSVAMAANDPIFWLHHCNVDRLWSLWMDQQIKKNEIRSLFPAEGVAAWLDESFPNQFWMPDGTLASETVRSSLFTEGLAYNYDTMEKTWTITDIPNDQATYDDSAPVEKAESAPASLRLADAPGSTLSLQFTLPDAIYTSRSPIQSLRLRLEGVPVPQESGLSYSVSIVVQGKILPLPEIVFFLGEHGKHKPGVPGVSLAQHLKILQALPAGQRKVQVILVQKDLKGNPQAIANLSTDPSRYKVRVKAVFK